MLPSKEQEKSYEYFKSILPELLGDPFKNRKYVIVYGEAVKGVFDTFATAYKEACASFKKDFIIQQVIDESKVNNHISPAVVL